MQTEFEVREAAKKQYFFSRPATKREGLATKKNPPPPRLQKFGNTHIFVPA